VVKAQDGLFEMLPVYWVGYDFDTHEVIVQWDIKPDLGIVKHQLAWYDTAMKHTFDPGAAVPNANFAVPDREVKIPCGSSDGRTIDVRIRFETDTPQFSDWSVPYTVMCAGYPGPPGPPELVLGTRDEISVSWSPPPDNGGSPPTGYLLYIRKDDEVEYVLVYDEPEEANGLNYSTIVTHLGDIIYPGDYYISVKAANWVSLYSLAPGTNYDMEDIGSMSPDLVVIIPYLSDPLKS
jgi:hypothetical protein